MDPQNRRPAHKRFYNGCKNKQTKIKEAIKMKQTLESSIQRQERIVIQQEAVPSFTYDPKLEDLVDREILRMYNMMMHQIKAELPNHIPQGWYHKLVRKFKESRFSRNYHILHELFLSRENLYEKTLEVLRYIFGEGNRDQGLEFAIKKDQSVYTLEVKSKIRNSEDIYNLIKSEFNRLYLPPRRQELIQVPRPSLVILESPKYSLV